MMRMMRMMRVSRTETEDQKNQKRERGDDDVENNNNNKNNAFSRVHVYDNENKRIIQNDWEETRFFGRRRKCSRKKF